MLFQIINEYQSLAEKGYFPLLICKQDNSRLFCGGNEEIELYCLECDTRITLGKAKYDTIERSVKEYYAQSSR